MTYAELLKLPAAQQYQLLVRQDRMLDFYAAVARRLNK